MELNNIDGIIYDLDGTLINTGKLHEEGWKYAGDKFNVEITPSDMLNYQKGRTGIDAGSFMLKTDNIDLINKFRLTKKEYVNNNLDHIEMFPNFFETYEKLLKNDKAV